MKMQRILIFIALILFVIAVAFAGCGNAGEGDGLDEQNESDKIDDKINIGTEDQTNETKSDDEALTEVEKLKQTKACPSCDLSQADLSAIDLADADLSGANLTKANLSNTDLSGANLRASILTQADLSMTNLSGANLSGAKINLADLNASNLSNADLRNANLNGADLTDADLSGANLDRATTEDTIFNNIITDENTKGINIEENDTAEDTPENTSNDANEEQTEKAKLDPDRWIGKYSGLVEDEFMDLNMNEDYTFKMYFKDELFLTGDVIDLSKYYVDLDPFDPREETGEVIRQNLILRLGKNFEKVYFDKGGFEYSLDKIE